LKDIQDRETKRSTQPKLRRNINSSLNSSINAGNQNFGGQRLHHYVQNNYISDPNLNNAGRLEIPNVSFHQRSHAYSEFPKANPAASSSSHSLSSSSSSSNFPNESTVNIPNQIPQNRTRRGHRPDVSKMTQLEK
jgi:hypothetical protein